MRGGGTCSTCDVPVLFCLSCFLELLLSEGLEGLEGSAQERCVGSGVDLELVGRERWVGFDSRSITDAVAKWRS